MSRWNLSFFTSLLLHFFPASPSPMRDVTGWLASPMSIPSTGICHRPLSPDGYPFSMALTLSLPFQCVPSYRCCPPVDTIIKVFGKAVVHLEESWIMVWAVGAVCPCLEGVSCQCVHVDLSDRHRAHHLHADGWRFAGCFRWTRAGTRVPSTIAKAGYARIRWRGRGSLDELTACFEPHFLVLLNVDTDGQNGHCFGHNERERSEVERPTVVILVLLVFIPIVTGVTGIAGDVDDYTDDVAQTYQTQNRARKA